MTNEEIDAIREHVSYNDVSIHDVIPLLAEVERLTALTEESEHQMHLRIRAGYDKTVADAWRAEVKKQSEAAFRRGVAAMRRDTTKMLVECSDALLRNMRDPKHAYLSNVVALELTNAARALPDPEDR